MRPLPLVRNLPSQAPEGDAYFQFARNMVKGMKELPGARQVRGCRGSLTKGKFADGLALSASCSST